MNWMTILSYAVDFLARTIILFVLLAIMIRVQKLDFKFLGVLICAALGSALDMIPVVGHYIAVPVLWIGIARVCNTDMVPDAVFTVAVAYALMFCVNLFLLGMLMGDLRPSAQMAGTDDEIEMLAALDDTNKPARVESEPVALKTNKTATNTVAQKPVATNNAVTASAPAKATAQRSTTVATNKPAEATKPGMLSKLNPFGKKPATEVQPTAKTNVPAAPASQSPALAAANSPVARKAVPSYRDFTLRGISGTSTRRFALVANGGKIVTIAAGEETLITVGTASTPVRCEEVRTASAVFNIDGETVELALP